MQEKSVTKVKQKTIPKKKTTVKLVLKPKKETPKIIKFKRLFNKTIKYIANGIIIGVIFDVLYNIYLIRKSRKNTLNNELKDKTSECLEFFMKQGIWNPKDTENEFDKKYRKWTLKFHPDKTNDPNKIEIFKKMVDYVGYMKEFYYKR